MNKTLEKFLNKIVEEFKRENEDREREKESKYDIPFLISVLSQSFENDNTYDKFCEDLEKYSDYGICIVKPQNDYNGICDVTIDLYKYIEVSSDGSFDECFDDYETPDYEYLITFQYDSRDWGYCECTPDMPDYREDKHCCGHGCDYSAPSFDLYRVRKIAGNSWKGDEHDLWDFEDNFYLSDKELSDKKEKEDKEAKIKELHSVIENAQKQLKQLIS